jgi:hypothetical protein
MVGQQNRSHRAPNIVRLHPSTILTVWSAKKTEAIDPTSDFWWVDDDPTEDDRAWLHSHNRQDRLIEVSSDRDAGALLAARAVLGAVQPQ